MADAARIMGKLTSVAVAGQESEIWRPVVGYEGRYEVSSLARVRSLARQIYVTRSRRCGGEPYYKRVPAKMLVPNLSRFSGYFAINLSKEAVNIRHSLHVLVCAAFHGPRPQGYIVAHNDGNRFNNRADNLRYATYSENALDKEGHGTGTSGTRNWNAKLTEDDVRIIKRAPPSVSNAALAESYGMSVATIRSIRLGDRWKHITV